MPVGLEARPALALAAPRPRHRLTAARPRPVACAAPRPPLGRGRPLPGAAQAPAPLLPRRRPLPPAAALAPSTSAGDDQPFALSRLFSSLFPSAVDGLVLRAVLPPFAAAFAACLSLGLTVGALIGLVREAVASGLPLGTALGIAGWQLPRYALAALPPACLAGALLGLSSLRASGELVALRAAGVGPLGLLRAPMALALAAAAAAAAAGHSVVPWASVCGRQAVAAAAQEMRLRPAAAAAAPKSLVREFADGGSSAGAGLAPASGGGAGRRAPLKRLWYVDDVSRLNGLGGDIAVFRDILGLELDPTGRATRVLLAGGAQLNMPKREWSLEGGTGLSVSPCGGARTRVHAKAFTVPMPIEPGMVGASGRGREAIDPETLSIAELPRPAAAARVARLQAAARQPGDPSAARRAVASARAAELELVNRDGAVAACCVVYALIGAAAALQRSADDRAAEPTQPLAAALTAVGAHQALGAAAAAAAASGLAPAMAAGLGPSMAVTVAAVAALAARGFGRASVVGPE